MTARKLRELAQIKRNLKFTNRDNEVLLFNSLIESNSPKFNILSMHGIGGAGKSMLLDKFQEICIQKPIFNARIDGKIHQSIVKLSHGIREQLSGSLWRNYFREFDKNLVRYLEIQGAIEKNDISKNAIQLLLSTGVALDPTGISGKVGKDVISASLSFITSVLKKADIDFYIQSEQILAQSLVAGLSKLTDEKLVIFFDTYEEFPKDVKNWVEQIFINELSEKTFVVISGRERLDGAWMDWESNGLMKQIELVNFNKVATQTMLANAGILEQAIVDEIFNFTQGHPLCISLVTEIGINPEQKYIIIDTLIERVLSQIKDIEIFGHLEALSVPRFYNDDLLGILLPDKNFSASKFKKYSFVRWHEKGFSLHDLIRNYYTTKMRLQSQDRWHQLNKKIISYYKKISNENSEFSGKWVDANIEIIYHEFALSEKNATKFCVEMFYLAEIAFNLPFAKEILQSIIEIEFKDIELGQWRMLLHAKYMRIIRDWPKAFKIYYDILGIATNPDLVLASSNGLAIVSSQMNDLQKSLTYANNALDLAKKLGRRDDVFDALYAIGKSLHRQGKFQEGVSLLNSYLDDFNDHSMAMVLEMLGLLYLSAGDLANSIDCYKRAKNIWDNLGNIWKSTMAQYGIGCVLCEEKKWEESESILVVVLKKLDEIGDNDGIAKSLSKLARIKIGKNEYEQAILLSKRSSEIYRDMGDNFGRAVSQNILSLAYRHIGDLPSALKYYKDSLKINHSSGNYEREASTLLNMARIYIELGNKKISLNHARAAYMLARKLNLPNLISDAEKIIRDISQH